MIFMLFLTGALNYSIVILDYYASPTTKKKRWYNYLLTSLIGLMFISFLVTLFLVLGVW